MEKKWDWTANETDKSLAITTVLFYISEQSIISGSRSKQTGAWMVRKNPLQLSETKSLITWESISASLLCSFSNIVAEKNWEGEKPIAET